MILTVIFLLSGISIALLLFTKVRQMKTRQTPLLLRVISRGDERMKDLSHRSAHLYADTKEDLRFFLEKQLPLRAKNAWNKSQAVLKEKWKLLMDDLRDQKLLKKKGNLSDYFQAREEEIHMHEELMEAVSESEAAEDANVAVSESDNNQLE